jgi:hypothetical protein
MKDLRITAKRQKTELKFFLFCFITAFVLNLASILIYKTNWIELISSIGYVMVLAVILYAISVFLRLIWVVIRKGFRLIR